MISMIKKITAAMLAAAMLLCCFAGCKGEGRNDGKLRIVATIFPEYDWLRQIIGEDADNIELTLLTSGVDLHSYQPSVEDIVKISSCDMFVYVGGESDKWVSDVEKNTSKDKTVMVPLLELLGSAAKQEELVEGMQSDEDEDELVSGYDEHVWLSVKNAVIICRGLAEKLCELDSGNSEKYKTNADKYIERLNELDAEYQAAADAANCKTLLFGDRFPFRYLADDYGLTYYAAFSGCSAETEASFGTVVFLAEKADAEGLRNIIRLEDSDGSVARIIKENTVNKDQNILIMDSMQSVSAEDVKNGLTYLDIMQKDLEVLKKAME